MARNNNRNNRLNNNVARNNNKGRNNSTTSRSSGSGLSGSSIFIIVVILIALVGVYFYMQQNKATGQENFESTKLKPTSDKELTMALFYAEWCGHCKNFKPDWEKVKNQLDQTRINGVKINMVSIDCDKEGDLAKQYDVADFPTIKCITKDKVIEYDEDRSAEAVTKFVREKAQTM